MYLIVLSWLLYLNRWRWLKCSDCRRLLLIRINITAKLYLFTDQADIVHSVCVYIGWHWCPMFHVFYRREHLTDEDVKANRVKLDHSTFHKTLADECDQSSVSIRLPMLIRKILFIVSQASGSRRWCLGWWHSDYTCSDTSLGPLTPFATTN